MRVRLRATSSATRRRASSAPRRSYCSRSSRVSRPRSSSSKTRFARPPGGRRSCRCPVPSRVGDPVWERSRARARGARACGAVGRPGSSGAGEGGAGSARLVRGRPRRISTAREAARLCRSRSAGELRVQEAMQAVVNTLRHRTGCSSLARTRAPRVARPQRASQRPGVVGPRLGRVLGRPIGSSRHRTPPTLTTSRASTGSRCRKTIFRSRSSQSTAADSSSRGSIRSEALVLARSSSASNLPSTSRCWASAALWGGDAASSRASALLGRAAVPGARLAGAEPSLVDRTTMPSYSSSSAEPRKPSASWTSGRRTRCGSAASGCSRTWPVAGGFWPSPTGTSTGRDSPRRAIERHEAVGDPYGRARTLLALGTARRRMRQKRARPATRSPPPSPRSRSLGAEVWAGKARGELGRIGGRTREQGLTAAERRVAALVAQGRTNREVAGAALPRRTNRRKPPDSHLRQARNPLAHRARASASKTSRAKFRRSDVSTASSPP